MRVFGHHQHSGGVLLASVRSRILLVLISIPIAILKNAIRITTISCLGLRVNRGFFYGNLHRNGGLPFLSDCVIDASGSAIHISAVNRTSAKASERRGPMLTDFGRCFGHDTGNLHQK